MSPEPGGVQSPHVLLPEENGPVRDLVEVFDESDTCRLPSAARTHQSHHLARLHLETDALLYIAVIIMHFVVNTHKTTDSNFREKLFARESVYFLHEMRLHQPTKGEF